MSAEFIHLHNHTEYSLLDGACRLTDDAGNPSELFGLISKEHKMSALAITDHGNMFGAMEFYWAARKSGIKPIIGCEVYVSPKSCTDKKAPTDTDEGRFYNHLILLAKNFEGYQNLMQIVSKGYLDGFYYKPRVDKAILKEYKNGIICLSGCILGEVASNVLWGRKEEALAAAVEYSEIFGKDNYYIEIMDHGLPEQKQVIPGLLEISKQAGIPPIVTNDCHFLRKSDHDAHDVLICIGTNKLLTDINRMHYPELAYYRSAEEMAQTFSYLPQGLKNTLEVAEKVNLEINTGQLLLPAFPVPEGYKDDAEYLEKLCFEGLARRYKNITSQHTDRLKHELSVINKMGFASYFLIVSDFIRYAKDNKIAVGPGRGSGAGSMVAYTLEVTDICPLQYGLLFERFLNPDRRTMPDLDIDFDSQREKVIDYVRNKYGSEKCAQIITFGSLQARQSIKDVARTMEFTPAQSNEIAKLIPEKMSIAEAIKSTAALRKLIDDDQSGKLTKLLSFSQKLEGLKRHTGVHAAAMVIANDDIIKYSPLAKGSKNIITTQYDGIILPQLGLLKVDFLGLKTLNIIDDCIKLIKEEKNKDFDIDNIPLDDKNAYELLSSAKTLGVFQLESSGLRDLMIKLKPETIDDIIALIALYRPGPLGSGMTNDFVERKHGHRKIEYDHVLEEPILKETYGVILYQEQVMRLSMDLAGFTPGEADNLRKAMSKKSSDVMAAQREKFIEGAKKNGIKRTLAGKIYSNIESFGGYGFNKSHSAAYGLVSYRTAYLKANYPLEYIASMLNSEIGRSSVTDEDSRMVMYIEEAENFGIKILPPDVQFSKSGFSIEDGNIRFGLFAIKSVGEGITESIVNARKDGDKFKSWSDFLERIDLKSANKLAFEAMIKAGAFDCFGAEGEDNLLTRAILLNNVEYSLSAAAKIKADRASAQCMLFGPQEGADRIILGNSNTKPLEKRQSLEFEKSVLGFYLSDHPFAKQLKELEGVVNFNLNDLPVPAENPQIIKVAGMAANIRKSITKRGRKEMAKIRLEDLHSSVEVVIFPQVYEQYVQFINQDDPIVIKGKLMGTDDKKEIHANEIIPYAKSHTLPQSKRSQIYISIQDERYDDKLESNLKRIFAKHPGRARVSLIITNEKNEKFCIDTEYLSDGGGEFISEISKEIGDDSAVQIKQA
ncbi:MAG: DNA polymerase III subunit alpha [Elusimicrobiota bacterium]|jgi:DNA polymerase-3 subunit alpha|nr:DNA polymerase III subunit alpha [Elusimicrobiota bacterium]